MGKMGLTSTWTMQQPKCQVLSHLFFQSSFSQGLELLLFPAHSLDYGRHRKQKACSKQENSLTLSLLILHAEQVSPCGTWALETRGLQGQHFPPALLHLGEGIWPCHHPLVLRIAPLKACCILSVFLTSLSPRLCSKQACMLWPLVVSYRWPRSLSEGCCWPWIFLSLVKFTASAKCMEMHMEMHTSWAATRPFGSFHFGVHALAWHQVPALDTALPFLTHLCMLVTYLYHQFCCPVTQLTRG